jgi:hypothetical protein
VQTLPRAKILAAMLADEDASGTRTRAFVEAGEIPAALTAPLAALEGAPPLPSVAGRVVSYAGNRIETEVTAPAAGLVVLNEKWFAGWRVTVDGREATPLRANHLLRAVPVEAGAHRIVWTFEPRRFGGLVALWGAGVAFLGIAATFSLRARRRAR